MTPNSRSYITQFTQPDSIIPNPNDPLSWNRYAYVRYNPILYNDPTSHKVCDTEDGTVCDWKGTYLWDYAERIVKIYGGKDDLLGMVKIVNAGAKIYGDFNSLLPALTEIFIGSRKTGPGALISAVRAGGCSGVGREPRDCHGNTYYAS